MNRREFNAIDVAILASPLAICKAEKPKPKILSVKITSSFNLEQCFGTFQIAYYEDLEDPTHTMVIEYEDHSRTFTFQDIKWDLDESISHTPPNRHHYYGLHDVVISDKITLTADCGTGVIRDFEEVTN